MEQDDPTAGGDEAPGEMAKNAPKDAPDANEDDGGNVNRSRSTDTANTSSAPIATNGTARKKKTSLGEVGFQIEYGTRMQDQLERRRVSHRDFLLSERQTLC